MSKDGRIGIWLLCGAISVVVSLIMSPWSVLACFGCFCVSVAVSMHNDKVKADAA